MRQAKAARYAAVVFHLCWACTMHAYPSILGGHIPVVCTSPTYAIGVLWVWLSCKLPCCARLLRYSTTLLDSPGKSNGHQVLPLYNCGMRCWQCCSCCCLLALPRQCSTVHAQAKARVHANASTASQPKSSIQPRNAKYNCTILRCPSDYCMQQPWTWPHPQHSHIRNAQPQHAPKTQKTERCAQRMPAARPALTQV